MDLDPVSRDLLIRTVIGEAGAEPDEGKAAVAGVVLNRLRSGDYGDSVAKVVLAKNQFEPWGSRRQEKPAILLMNSRAERLGTRPEAQRTSMHQSLSERLVAMLPVGPILLCLRG
jgi:spore germination cell wall hydrolase CwlJ-like protein